MKKSVFIFLVAVLPAFLFTSCIFWGPSVKGNGNVVEEEREVTGFNGIKTSRGVNVYISQGDGEKVVIEADENLVDIIETDVENSILKVTTRRRIREATSTKVFVTFRELEEVKAFAGSNVYSEKAVRAGNMDVSASAGSNIKLDVAANKMEVSASAGANIFLEGTAREISVHASAGSNVKAEGLVTEVCRAKAGSGANIYITVEKEMEGRASSGGNVFYSGNPQQINASSSSGGNVKKR